MNWWTTDEWSVGHIWHWSDPVQRAILIGFALMLGYAVFVVVRFSGRYYLGRHKLSHLHSHDSRELRRTTSKLIADMHPGLGMLRGIGSAAPLLGLAGSSYGILVGMSFGFSGTPSRFIAVLSARVSAALIWTAFGIVVAIPATASHKLLRGFLEDLSMQSSSKFKRANDTELFHFAQALQLKTRSSALPPYALLALLPLLCVVCLYMTLEPNTMPTGLSVSLRSDRCGYSTGRQPMPNRIVVLRITNSGQVFINMEPERWTDLRRLLGEIYRARQQRELYLLAEDKVPFQTVADAIDTARNSPGPGADSLDIKVVVLTLQASQQCAPIPVLVVPKRPGFQMRNHIPVALHLPLR